ncbi:MAG: SpoIIIAH-like family protein [Tissierella sp.]|nr:SpoIIIAH-like family protein [Tissierella sp.]
MFKIKRPAIIGLLLILLIFTGYLNYQFTQQALRKTSQEYQRHEAAEMQNYLNSNDFAIEDEENIEIVDSIVPEDGNIAEVVSSSNDMLKEEIDKEVANLNRNYFVEQRLSRDKLRANLIDRLTSIVNNDQTNDSMRTEAQEEIINIGRISETELQIEGLVNSKGFDEALVLLTDEDIKVIVSVEELTETEMVKILDIVRSETEFDIDNIKIMKKQ